MSIRIPFDPDYVQLVGTAVYVFSYYEWTIIYVVERLNPGFVSEYSRKRKMTSGAVSNRLKEILSEDATNAVQENQRSLRICTDEFASLIPRRNALIHAHPMTDGTSGAQLLNFQSMPSESIADLKWNITEIEQFIAKIDKASARASALLSKL